MKLVVSLRWAIVVCLFAAAGADLTLADSTRVQRDTAYVLSSIPRSARPPFDPQKTGQAKWTARCVGEEHRQALILMALGKIERLFFHREGE